MRKASVLALLACLLVLASCQTVTFQGLPVVKEVPPYTVVKDFSTTIGDPTLIAGLLPLSQPDQRIYSYIKEEIDRYSGDAAINVELDYGVSFFDLILTSLTGSIYSPRTITISGTIIKYSK